MLDEGTKVKVQKNKHEEKVLWIPSPLHVAIFGHDDVQSHGKSLYTTYQDTGNIQVYVYLLRDISDRFLIGLCKKSDISICFRNLEGFAFRIENR